MMYVTEGARSTDNYKDFYDFTVSNLTEVQYLIDMTLGKNSNNSHVMSSSSMNSSLFQRNNSQNQQI